jgi:DNA polymerase III epsilon subunit-like protein
MLVFDIETNGLLDTVSKFHCGTTVNPLTLEVEHYNDPYKLSLALSETDLIIGHNILGYDLTALHILTGETIVTSRFDTLVAARLLNPEGQHSLEAYGRKLGFPKGDYKGGWENYSEEMGKYCFRDTTLCAVLFLELVKRMRFEENVGIPRSEIPRLQEEIRSLRYG